MPTYQHLVEELCNGWSQNPLQSLGDRSQTLEQKISKKTRDGSVTASSTLSVAVLTKDAFQEALQSVDQLSKQHMSLRSLVQSLPWCVFLSSGRVAANSLSFFPYQYHEVYSLTPHT